MHIALAGKGSSGKSTLAAVMVEWLRAQQGGRPLLVDADPHQSLCTLLACEPAATLGGLRSQYERALLSGRDAALRPDETRLAFAERLLSGAALHHAADFDLLALGQWELPGSQCVPNRVLGYALAQLLPAYPLALIDHEAGIEHIGRFCELPIDRLLIVATPEALSLEVAGRIVEHARAVGRRVASAALVLNRVQGDDLADPALEDTLARLAGLGLPLTTVLPESRALRAASRAGAGPLTLDAADPWRQALTAALPALLGPLPTAALPTLLGPLPPPRP